MSMPGKNPYYQSGDHVVERSTGAVSEKEETELVKPGQHIVYGSLLMRSMRFLAGARPAAYASEVGESARPIVPKWMVNLGYGVSGLYVVADVYLKGYDTFTKTGDQRHTNIVVVDSLVWHSLASMTIPAVTIHSIVKYSAKPMKRANFSPKVCRTVPSLIGLVSIPLIIHPIDHLTDYLLDNTIRKFYKL